MNDFQFWFVNGFWHILDFSGYDHMLFLLALTGLYEVKEWKKLLILVTAFTIGHSITLMLSTLEILAFSSDWVEMLIPLTIMTTCYQNVFPIQEAPTEHFSANYWIALIFGFIHGLGFSTQLKMLLGRQEQIAFELLSFNVGIEGGQVLFILIILTIKGLLTGFAQFNKKNLNTITSIAVFAWATVMLIQRVFILFE